MLLRDYGYCQHEGCKLKAGNSRGLCPGHTKERHIASAESKGMVVKEREPIQYVRKSDILPKIAKISDNKKTELSALARIKKQKIEAQGKVCEMCGKQGEVDLFHLIPVGNKETATNPYNLYLSCRLCHLIWGAMDYEKILKFLNFDSLMATLKELDESKFWKFWHKIEEFKLAYK